VSAFALDNPLVREYVRELDAALVRLPAGQASELREQIIAHIGDAVPPDATDEQVAAVLARLGSPAELAAEATASAPARAADEAGLGGPRDDTDARPPGRARSALRTWWFWVTASAIVAVVALVAVMALVAASNRHAAETAPVLLGGGAMSWWYPQDRAHEVDTSVDGASQSTVPIRSGQWQGFVIDLFNRSHYTQTVLGVASNGPSAFAGAGGNVGIIGVSTPNREVDMGGGSYTGVKFVLPGVIPPHQLRALRVLWISNTCLDRGSYEGNDEIALRVRVGPITRTEVVWLTQGWFVTGPSTGKYAVTSSWCR
jgi:hypothetical protein